MKKTTFCARKMIKFLTAKKKNLVNLWKQITRFKEPYTHGMHHYGVWAYPQSVRLNFLLKSLWPTCCMYDTDELWV